MVAGAATKRRAFRTVSGSTYRKGSEQPGVFVRERRAQKTRSRPQDGDPPDGIPNGNWNPQKVLKIVLNGNRDPWTGNQQEDVIDIR
jgi:hypothetical protein